VKKLEGKEEIRMNPVRGSSKKGKRLAKKKVGRKGSIMTEKIVGNGPTRLPLRDNGSGHIATNKQGKTWIKNNIQKGVQKKGGSREKASMHKKRGANRQRIRKIQEN